MMHGQRNIKLQYLVTGSCHVPLYSVSACHLFVPYAVPKNSW